MMKYLNEDKKAKILLGLILIVFIIGFNIMEPKFLQMSNITLFFKQLPLLGIIGIGITMVLITGAIDLSIGSIAALSGTLAVYFAVNNYNPIICLLLAIISGVICGAVNGFLVTRFKLQPFILTLGTNLVIRGSLLAVTAGMPISGIPDWFYAISNTHIIGPIYSNTIVFIIIAIIASFLLQKTRFGRYSYAVGSNTEAARLSGIKTKTHIIKVYMIEASFAAIAGILLMSTINSGGPNEANGIDLYGLAAAIIGGAQFSGGVGTISGSIIGVLIIRVIQSGLAILGVNSFTQQAIIGIIIVVAIIIDSLRSNRRKK